MKKSQRNIENVDVISHNHTKSLHKSALLTKQDAFLCKEVTIHNVWRPPTLIITYFLKRPFF